MKAPEALEVGLLEKTSTNTVLEISGFPSENPKDLIRFVSFMSIRADIITQQGKVSSPARSTSGTITSPPARGSSLWLLLLRDSNYILPI